MKISGFHVFSYINLNGMKRILMIITAALLAFSVQTSAQGKFGITAGMNFNAAKIKDVKMDAKAGWSAGVTYKLDLPLGFSFQPSLVYMQKNAVIVSDQQVGFWDDIVAGRITQKVGSLVLPVSVQWGPDLLVARPFVDVTPYVGYSLANKLEGKGSGFEGEIKGKQAFDYGLGLGAGLDIWKLQVIVRYNWNFGVLGGLKDFTGIDWGGLKTDNQTFGGLSVNLSFFF